jgi:hypothetical protein
MAHNEEGCVYKGGIEVREPESPLIEITELADKNLILIQTIVL